MEATFFLLLLLCSLLSLASSLWGQPGLRADVLSKWTTKEGRVHVLLPPRGTQQIAVIHFIGGFLVGHAAALSYNDLLEDLSTRGFIICATPIPLVTLNHGQAASKCAADFRRCYSALQCSANLPVIGLSHSLGGKLTALCACTGAPSLNRANVFLAFNNYPMASGDKQFDPSPQETWDLISSSYSVPRNLAVRFDRDNIDQSTELDRALKARGSAVQSSLLLLPGDHLTPNRRDLPVFARLADAMKELL